MSTSSSTVVQALPDDLFDQPSADITLRSSDNIDLHVHSQILSQASPIFSTMLSLPQPQASRQSAESIASTSLRPVIDVPEDSKTLRTLLRLCYPVSKEALTELDSIVLVLKAALKYEMDWPTRLLERDLVAIIPRRPLNVWAIAARCGLEELASKAASEIRARATAAGKPPLDILGTMLVEGKYGCLEGVSAGDYFRLREWLQKDSDPAFKFLESDGLHDVLDWVQLGIPFVPRISSPDLLVHARGSDKPKHRVHGVILAWHSTILAEQVEAVKAQNAHLPADTIPTEQLEAGSSPQPHLPVLELDVDHVTLYYLLDVCYNGAERLPSTPYRLASLIVASEKLGITQVRTLANAAWQDAASADPMEAYFVALQHKLDSQARAAARKVLERPLKGWYASAMESSPAMEYQRLLDYYHACALSVSDELCRVAELCRTLAGRKDSPGADPAVVPNYIRDLGQRAVAKGPGLSIGERNEELSLSALFSRTCVMSNNHYWGAICSWPRQDGEYCRNLVDTMLEIGSTLETSVPNAIAQVSALTGTHVRSR